MDKIAHLLNRRANAWAYFDLVQFLNCDQKAGIYVDETVVSNRP